MHAAGGIASHDEREITLNETGRYLLLVMMRETLATSNDLRDQARAALPLEERMLLFDNPDMCREHVEECLAAS